MTKSSNNQKDSGKGYKKANQIVKNIFEDNGFAPPIFERHTSNDT